MVRLPRFAATIRTIDNAIPIARPFLAPDKWTIARGAIFFGQILFRNPVGHLTRFFVKKGRNIGERNAFIDKRLPNSMRED